MSNTIAQAQYSRNKLGVNLCPDKKHWQFAQAQNSNNCMNEPGETGPSWGEKICNPNEEHKLNEDKIAG